MIQIKKMQAERLYMIKGESTANSSFFENLEDCKEFLSLADYYLKDYLFINSFQNSRDGWIMIITTKGRSAIKKAYGTRRTLSKKCKEGCEHQEVWRILSDQIRIWLSTYVKRTNQRSGREGGKVKGNYERYVFESVEEAQEVRKKLAERQFDQSQPRKRYRPSRKLSKLPKRFAGCSIYLSCKRLNTVDRIKKLGIRCLNLMGLVENVLRHLVPTTLHHHFPT